MKERESNIELFRVVATLMILVVHCNGWFLSEWGGITSWTAGKGLIVGGTRALIQSLSCIGVDCFILISGYFSIKPKLKSIVNLYSVMVFCYMFCYVLSIFVGSATFEWNLLIKNLFAFSAGGNWFIQSYLMLLLLSPMINVFVDKCSEKSLLIYIAIYMSVMYYFSAIWDAEKFFFNHGYSFATFICLYLVGRYIRKYGLQRMNLFPKWVSWLTFACLILLMTLIRVVNIDEERWLSYESPLLIVSAAFLLICFAQLSIHSRLINWIAPSCLMVFLFHTCSPIIDWFALWDVRCFINFPFELYLLRIGGGVLIVYTSAVLLDSIRRILMRPINKLISDKSNGLI